MQSFPDGGDEVSVSNQVVAFPRWSRDGTELYYAEDEMVMAVEVSTEGGCSTESLPSPLFAQRDLGKAFGYEVSSDARFLVAEDVVEAGPQPIHVRLNWYAEFRD